MKKEILLTKIKDAKAPAVFDVYDYHDFSGYKEYKGRTACQPRNCVNSILAVEKTPQNMNKLLSEADSPTRNW